MKIDTLKFSAALMGSVLSCECAMADDSSDILEEIIVIAHPLSGEGLSQATDVLQGTELERKRSTSIGQTLANEPGIHSAQFGSAVGRPVIHGLGGPRVRVMEDRIDVLDLSVTSADHAVAIEPFIADRIEIIKGPSTLLYGSGAIGGVVDVHTGRIPHTVPDQEFSGGLETRFDNNTDGHASVLEFNGGRGKLAWHLDGTWKDGDDYEIPGYAESARFRAIEEEGHEEETRGVVPGSAFDAKAYAGGVSYIFDRGFIGVSLSKMKADYGLPGGHGHEEDHEEGDHEEGEHEEGEHEEGNPFLELEQTRTDFEFGLSDPFGMFSSLNVRLGINDYEHKEIEATGEIASTFSNEAWELRTELVYNTELWSGTLGFQHTDREFSAIGEEAFVPPVDTRDSGLFWVAERSFSSFDLEGGMRVGKVQRDLQDGSGQDFTTYSASLGFVVPLSDGLQVGLLSDYSARAPVTEELYSNGPHLVTNAFEVGDPDLDKERAVNLAATLRYAGEVWQATLTTYITRFSDFIFEQTTGNMAEGLPIFQFQQEDARFLGFDVEVSAKLFEWEDGSIMIRGMADYVDAELDVSGNDNLPRIPPMRFGAGLEFKAGKLTASLDYMGVSEQDDVAEGELMSPDYEDLSAYIGMTIPLGRRLLSVFAQGKNLTDDEQRHHTSFIKEFAPASGRTIEVGVRLLF